MPHVDDRSASRRTVRPSRSVGWLIVVATCMVGACDGDQDHPPFAPCGTLDGAIARTDAGPDAGKTAFVSCGDTTRVPVGGAVPPGGPPPTNSGGGDINGGIGGSGAAIGGNGASLGGIDGVGAGGLLSGIGGTTPGFGGGAATTGNGATGTGIGGTPFGSPGIGGFGP